MTGSRIVGLALLGMGIFGAGEMVLANPVYSFTGINGPGNTSINLFGINDRGRIVGYLDDVSQAEGFLYVAGSFTSISYPGARLTTPLGINSSGEIVGAWAGLRQPGTHRKKPRRCRRGLQRGSQFSVC